MDSKGQSALEYLMTYGWALVVIAIIIGVLVVLLGSSTTVTNCSMSPAAGGIGYVDHAVNQDGELTIKFRNETGRTITAVAFDFQNDFGGATDLNSLGPYVSAEEWILGNAVPITTGIISGETYSGKIAISYSRQGIVHSAVAQCTGKAA